MIRYTFQDIMKSSISATKIYITYTCSEMYKFIAGQEVTSVQLKEQTRVWNVIILLCK